MSIEQNEFPSVRLAPADNLDSCNACGRSFTHSQFLDHLFHSKDCMRKYWEEEEKTHVFRLRHHRGSKNLS
jgi:hypothetical protein